MIRINEIKMSLDAPLSDLKSAAAKALKIKDDRIETLTVYKRSVDSRKKDNIFFSYAVDVTLNGNEETVLKKCGSNKISRVEPFSYTPPETKRNSPFRPVIVGFGPAGMMAGLLLAKAGLKPLILERGKDIDSRQKDVNNFWQNRILDETSNVQFGEGGAGTFSDGKLTTGIKDKRCRQVFIELADHGAPEEILYSGKPHIGTDKLAVTVKNIREDIIKMGGEILFGAQFRKLIVANGAVHGVTFTDNEGNMRDFETDAVILSIGHSARDTVESLYAQGINMMRKPFSVGARIEHPQELINKAQYGKFAGHPALGAADYKLACHPPHGRGAYTFCMCPGGTVVAATSEKESVVVNGMSEFARDGANSNSAVLVGIEPEDFPGEGVLAGMHYQKQIEHAAFLAGGSTYAAPFQLVGDFLKEQKSTKLSFVKPTCATGVEPSNLWDVLPSKVSKTMSEALVKMDNMLRGFALPDAVLTGVETRSSSPVRIIRDEFYQSNVRGLFPCGEGAGYAGGIISAGVDGLRCAEAVLLDLN